MHDAPIQFLNRYTARVQTEQVYGEAWLRWTYGTPLGRLALWAFVRRAWFSHWYGWRMDQPRSCARIAPFIARYGIEMADYAKAAGDFTSFNDFFYRTLKPGARPVDASPESVIFPADARHLGFQNADRIEGVFVKGQRFDLASLLGDAALAARYREGALVLSRLCPVDYHRFHFPVAGIPSAPHLINGPLESVNPIALRRRIGILWENKRVITRLETERLGTVLFMEIGATNVGGIVQTYSPGVPVGKGAEKGFFKFGGSSTLTLFEPGRVRLAEDLVDNSRQNRELYARMGDRLGTAL